MKRALFVYVFLLFITIIFPMNIQAATCYPQPDPDISCKSGEFRCRATGEVTCCPSREVCQDNAEQQQSATAAKKLASVCDYIPEGEQKTKCNTCFTRDKGSWTAIGCVSTEPTKFIAKFLGLGVGVGGGVAFLLILFGGFQILTSAGNPEQLNAGRELVSAAVTGLLLVIFSLFLVQLIGYNILGIPGFG